MGREEAGAGGLAPLRLTPFIPHRPTPRQEQFLRLECKEALFGGACGGGKSDSLLMAALQYVDVPGYRALLLRRSYADLSLPGALMERAEEWLGGTEARWVAREKTWHFPAGASLTFGYLEIERHKYRYQGAQFQFIGFDELTQHTESSYRYLFSRLRRPEGLAVPLRMRAASNPGGVGGPWVYQRFLVEGPAAGRAFIPARLEDNPHLDRAAYERSLAELDPITRAQLLEGDWEARPGGALFRREWFEVVEQTPKGLAWVRYWDLAATPESPSSPDPDWTAGVLMGERDGVYWIADVARARERPMGVERLVVAMARQDGDEVAIAIEEEPGSAGKAVIDHYARVALKGRDVHGQRTTGPKRLRANPLAAAAEAGNVKLVRSPWIGAFLDELEAFPHGPHDDQVDAASGALATLRRAAEPYSLYPE